MSIENIDLLLTYQQLLLVKIPSEVILAYSLLAESLICKAQFFEKSDQVVVLTGFELRSEKFSVLSQMNQEQKEITKSHFLFFW